MFGLQGLLLDVDGGILKVPGERLELIALGKPWDRFGMRVVLWWDLGGLLVPER